MKRGRGMALAIGCLVALAGAAPAEAQTIVDDWSKVEVPPPPALKPVAIDAKTTALLMLDFMHQNCGQRPRCMAQIPKLKQLLGEARAKGVAVIYSTPTAMPISDTIADVAAKPDEPFVQAGPDKFFHTDLEKILHEKGIQTVIVVGTASNGAVLNTASQAAFRGLNVILPVDGMSALTAYAEQYVAWNFATAPGVSNKTTLTRIDEIKF